MKKIFSFLFLFVIASAKLGAQSPTPPASPPSTSPTTPASPIPAKSPSAASNPSTDSLLPTPSPAPSAAIEPPSLIPQNILPPPNALPKVPSTPDLDALNAFFKQTSLGKQADDQRLLVETAKLETQIRNDPELHQLRAIALKERTDLERRHRLRTYYEAYYKKLGDLTTDPQLKAHIKAVEIGWISSLLQPKVRHETDEAALKALTKSNPNVTVLAAPTPVQAKTNQILRH